MNLGSYRNVGRVLTKAGVLQLATHSIHITAMGGDFLFQPVDPGAACLMELRDDGQEALQTDGMNEARRTMGLC